jgi:hypothetical protein
MLVKLEYFLEFRKNLKYKTSAKSFQQEPKCSMQMKGRTGTTKKILGFRNFASSPKNCEGSYIDKDRRCENKEIPFEKNGIKKICYFLQRC